MDRKIYHGGNRIVRKPSFGIGRPYNDFGLGFYCTESPKYAAEWAVRENRNGFVSAYSIDPDGLMTINLCGPQFNALHWLSLLLAFREFDLSSDTAHRAREYINKWFSVDYQGCDCIIGYRADNRLFMFAQDFLDGKLSYQDLKTSLSGASNRQFVLKSNRAFDRISFAGYSTACAEESFPVGRSRELRAIKKTRDIQNLGGIKATGDINKRKTAEQPVEPVKQLVKPASIERGLFITDLIEQEVRPYDSRL